MKYLIIGSNRQTGARMALEFEAESKAAAERKATQSGMFVNRVQDVTDGYPAHAQPAADYRPLRPRRRSAVVPIIIVLVIAIVLFIKWNSILGFLRLSNGTH